MAFSDIVVSGQNGFLVESPDELVKALEGYRVDDMLAKEHVLRGWAAAEEYSWSRIVE